MITVNNVSKSFGSRILFDSVNVAFLPGNRYGLTGPNGSGKSTFMRILTGVEDASNNGTVSRPRKVGILKQDQFAYDNHKLIDTVMMGNEILWNALSERNRLCELPDLTDEQMNKLGELECVIAEEDGYMAEVEAANLLRGFGIDDSLHEDMMNSLPTDYKFRVLLAQALFGNPEALLLDEPTNHLDLEAIHWLEEFLKEYDGALVVISHDRHFLNSVCTHIADIDYDTIILYPGNYDDMIEQKIQARKSIEAVNRDKQKKITQLQDFIARFAAGQRASQVQSRRKEIARLAPQELKRSNIQRPFIKFEQLKPAGRECLVATGLAKSFGDLHLFSDLSMEVLRGDKVAIIGPNGCGKTTLIKCLLGLEQLDAGEVRWGFGADWSYYPQDHTHEILPGMTVLDWLMQYQADEDTQIVRGILGRMLFSGDDGLKPTDGLSGGEQARLLLSRMQLQKNPIIVLDEPTNHLDLEAVLALAEALSSFPGTVFVVSHDRDLVSEVATKLISFTPQGVLFFQGTYDEYLQNHPLPEPEKKRKK